MPWLLFLLFLGINIIGWGCTWVRSGLHLLHVDHPYFGSWLSECWPILEWSNQLLIFLFFFTIIFYIFLVWGHMSMLLMWYSDGSRSQFKSLFKSYGAYCKSVQWRALILQFFPNIFLCLSWGLGGRSIRCIHFFYWKWVIVPLWHPLSYEEFDIYLEQGFWVDSKNFTW